jgi:exopolysaccharide biosynthesis polyprenyl glycosylphosphotransferase
MTKRLVVDERVEQVSDRNTSALDPPRQADAAPAPGHGPQARRRRGAILRRLLAFADALALVGAVVAVQRVGDELGVEAVYWTLVFLPAWTLVFKLSSLYDLDHRRVRHSTLDEIPRLLFACTLGAVALGGFLAAGPIGSAPSDQIVWVGALALAGSFFARTAVRAAWHGGTGKQIGLLIGHGTLATTVARRLTMHPESTIELVGYLADGEQGDSPLDAGAKALSKLGEPADIGALVDRYGLERVVVADQGLREGRLEQVISDCKAEGLSLTLVPQHSTLMGPGIELNRIGEFPLLDFRFGDPPRSTMLLKRGLDVVVSALGLVLLAPLFAVVAVLIKLDSRGRVFFRQARVGERGRLFKMVKFRTMVADAEQQVASLVDFAKLDQPVFKLVDDPRVTRVGRWLRRYSFDELPQLVNVLLGQMSLVGPRPEEEAIVALYDEVQRERLMVKPGMTGPMQVYGRADLSFEERLALERDYIDNVSILGDLAILLRTPAAILRGHGAY